MKLAALDLLLFAHDILGVQEVHGGPAEVLELQRRYHNSHIICFSFSSSTIAGGVILCVKRTFLATCTNVEFRVIHLGRAISIRVFSSLGTSCFICAHLLPQLIVIESQHFIRHVFRAVPLRNIAHTFIFGDWICF